MSDDRQHGLEETAKTSGDPRRRAVGTAGGSRARSNWPSLLLLAVGSFAVGTDGYVISGILPLIAADVHVSQAAAGQLVTAFALTYAISAPVLMTATAEVSRRAVLHASLAVFVVANVLGAAAQSYVVLLVARVLAGVGAAIYMNTAVATATALVEDRYRGRALSLVIGGLTLATALGVPIGTLVGQIGNWRLTLLLVAVLGLVATGGLGVTLRAVPKPPVITMASRIRAAARPAVLTAVLANLCAVAGSFTVFTYFAPLTESTTALGGTGISALLLAWGVAAAVGNVLGGRSSDRRGAERTFRAGVVGVVVAFLAMGAAVAVVAVGSASAIALLLGCTVVWSVMYWTVPPSQVQRVMERAPDAPTIAVSVSSSSSYLGVALGGAVGGIVLSRLSAAALPWAGAALELCALILVIASRGTGGKPHRDAA